MPQMQNKRKRSEREGEEKANILRTAVLLCHLHTIEFIPFKHTIQCVFLAFPQTPSNNHHSQFKNAFIPKRSLVPFSPHPLPLKSLFINIVLWKKNQTLVTSCPPTLTFYSINAYDLPLLQEVLATCGTVWHVPVLSVQCPAINVL